MVVPLGCYENYLSNKPKFNLFLNNHTFRNIFSLYKESVLNKYSSRSISECDDSLYTAVLRVGCDYTDQFLPKTIRKSAFFCENLQNLSKFWKAYINFLQYLLYIPLCISCVLCNFAYRNRRI